MSRVFISYAREDREVATRIYTLLRGAGCDPWLDTEDLRAGQKWRPAITRAIREAKFFLALISPRSLGKRGYVQWELGEALDVLKKVPENDIFLVPARLEPCEPSHEAIRDLNWLDLFPDFDYSIGLLVKLFHAGPEAADIQARVRQIDLTQFASFPLEVSTTPTSARVSTNARLDISSLLSTLPASLLRSLAPSPAGSYRKVISGVANIHSRVYRVCLHFAGATEDGIDVLEGEGPHAVIGANALRNSVVIFDGRQRSLRIFVSRGHL